MIEQLVAQAVPFSVDLITPFRSVINREGFVLIGEAGFGEFAPFEDYQPKAAAKWLAAAIEAANQPRLPTLRNEIPVNGIVPALEPPAAADWAVDLVDKYGVATLKVKVGDLAQVERIKQIRKRLPNIEIRVDANGSYDLATAQKLLPKFIELEVALIEQPCDSLSDCAELKGSGILIAVDESIRLAENVSDELISEIRNSADVAVLKPIPLGGSAPTLDLAKRLDLPIIVSGSLDTSIGLSFVAYVAALLPNQPLASGLGTSVLFKHDLVATPLVPENGKLEVAAIAPEPRLLQQAQERLNSAALIQLQDRLTEVVTEYLAVSEA